MKSVKVLVTSSAEAQQYEQAKAKRDAAAVSKPSVYFYSDATVAEKKAPETGGDATINGNEELKASSQ